ncbi:MAG: 30S ribosomal protein S6 [Rhodospirillales bacterium]|nr:30S ribosomal protein S6 [Rhodospirillales bacterium]
MPFYECVIIARQDMSAQQAEDLTDKLVALVSENGGEVAKKEYWGLRNLSYRIKKNRKGHYILLNLDAPPVCLAEVERNMRFDENILRYLTVKVKALDPNPSAILQRRDRDDRRGGRGDRGDRRDRPPPREQGVRTVIHGTGE